MQEKVKRLEKLNERLKEEKVELEFTASSMTKKCDELKNK
jgi:predicted nuclease with TOPRIM domain